jgi:hypothetical protein
MKPNIKQHDYIVCNAYVGLCDSIWTPDSGEPDPGIVHVSCDDVKTFFERYGNNGKDYILVSSSSDFGLYEQAQHPVWMDFYKGAYLIPPTALQTDTEYLGVSVAPRCNAESCNPKDKYSIKCHSWTIATFNEIPPNIKHWFLTNCMVDDPRCDPIPFGIFSNPNAINFIFNYPDTSKNRLLYINFQNYTRERYDIKRWFSTENWATVAWEANIPFEQFVAEMAQHWFVAAPPGNGNDSYRVLEAIYLGCIPIIELNHNARAYDGLPIIMATDLRKLTPGYAQQVVQEYQGGTPNYEKATLSYWRNKFEQARMEFL